MRAVRAALVPVVVACAVLAAPGTLAGTLEGSKHDFTGQSWAPRGQICVTCHAPINPEGGSRMPAWARQTAAGFRAYASATMQARPGEPGAVSKVCLSCHDGTLARDGFGDLRPGARGPGRDLSNDHPVGILYDADLARANGTLHDPALRLAASRGVQLFDNRVECATCHDVHNRNTAVGPGGRPGEKLLRTGTGGSALCLACHDK